MKQEEYQWTCTITSQRKSKICALTTTAVKDFRRNHSQLTLKFPPIQYRVGKPVRIGPAPKTWNASHGFSAFRSACSFLQRWSARRETKILKHSCGRRDSSIPPISKN